MVQVDAHLEPNAPVGFLPRGLMVFSSGSLSLLDFPLDMRAAMEKALARDDSCGLGEDVYSMSLMLRHPRYSPLNRTEILRDAEQLRRWKEQANQMRGSSSVRRFTRQHFAPRDRFSPLCANLSLCGRIHGEGRRRRRCPRCRIWGRRLFGKLQPDAPSPYNSAPASNRCPRFHVTLPLSRRGSDAEQPMKEQKDVKHGSDFLSLRQRAARRQRIVHGDK